MILAGTSVRHVFTFSLRRGDAFGLNHDEIRSGVWESTGGDNRPFLVASLRHLGILRTCRSARPELDSPFSALVYWFRPGFSYLFN
jgi:hypothetical protein